MKSTFLAVAVLLLFSCQPEDSLQIGQRWSAEAAWTWYDKQPWYVGTNFNPSTSINQLEFWQEETFDTKTLKRELGWSADIGMNIHRVYLHNLLWDQDAEGFLGRLDEYLSIANELGIKTMLVLLDDVWHPVPQLGKQPEPVPHLHNSGWVQAPGAAILGDTTRHQELEGYIKGVMTRYADDERVICWDLYNEPDNVVTHPSRVHLEVQDKQRYSLSLLKKVMRWAREVNPSQPITVGIWRGEIDNWGTPDKLPLIDKYMIENSDVISFHAYDGDIEYVQKKITELQKYSRPLLCTEYIARGGGNTFETMMPIFKEYKIAAINWGFVSGKTNTIYPWASWRQEFTSEPTIWHHDILRSDGTPYKQDEVDFIKKMIYE